LADKDGQPAHSWRLLVLPYLAEGALYEQYRFDEAWNSPRNAALATGVPTGMSPTCPIYHCHSDSSEKLETNKVMVVGKGTFSDGPTPRRDGDITDGIAHTIAVVEMSESGIHWMEPRDLKFDEMVFKINDPIGPGIRSKHPGLANVLMADGCVRSVREDIAPEVLKALLTIAGGKPIRWEDIEDR
jgi:prepilin-type processing-associated H-X9-DG protein